MIHTPQLVGEGGGAAQTLAKLTRPAPGAVGAAATGPAALLDTNGRARIMASSMTRLVRAKEVRRLCIHLYLSILVYIYTYVSRRRRGGGHPTRHKRAR